MTSRVRFFATVCCVTLPLIQAKADSSWPQEYHIEGDLRLAASAVVKTGDVLPIWIWAIHPQVYYRYSPRGGPGPRTGLSELFVSVLNGQGTEVWALKAPYPNSETSNAWSELQVPLTSLPAGEYTLQAYLTYDNKIYIRKRKRLVIEDPAHPFSKVVSGTDLASRCGLPTTNLLMGDGKQGALPVAVLSPGSSVKATFPPGKEQAAYALVYPPLGKLRVTSQNGLSIVEMKNKEAGFAQEYFLGTAKGGQALQIATDDGQFDIVQIRFETLTDAERRLAAVTQPGTRDKKLIVNNDGFSEIAHVGYDPHRIFEQVDRYQNTDVTRFDWATAGTAVVNYPSKYVDYLGAHQGPYVREVDRVASDAYNFLNQQKLPLYPSIVQRAAQFGLPVWGSLIINDYSTTDGFASVLNGRRWFEHPELRILVKPGVVTESPMSFAFPEIRKERLGVLSELAEFGCDGVNLDFLRYADVFGYEKPMLDAFAVANPGKDGKNYRLDDPEWISVREKVMNDFMRELRREMDSIGKARGHRVGISVRFPSTMYASFGLDPETWVKEGLVDQLIPGVTSFEHWFDVAPWVKVGHTRKVPVFATTMATNYHSAITELTDAQIASGMKPGMSLNMTQDEYFRRAAEVYADGADGLYIFNDWGRPQIFTGITDSTYVARWRRFVDPDNQGTERILSEAPVPK